MQTSEQIHELAAALAKAQGNNDHHAERALLQRMTNIRVSPGRRHQKRPMVERLLERVVFGMTDCWHWCSTRNAFGYGRFSVKGRTVVAHRVAYETFVGPIPGGMSVLHRCDNPSCINPDHLWLGTYSDNIRDCYAKGRRPRTRRKS